MLILSNIFHSFTQPPRADSTKAFERRSAPHHAVLCFVLGLACLFLLPESRKVGKELTQKWMRHRGFCTLGIQNGPFSACSAVFVSKNFNHPELYTGAPHFLLPQSPEPREPESWKWEKGFTITETLGIETGPFTACSAGFVPKIFNHPELHTGSTETHISYTRGITCALFWATSKRVSWFRFFLHYPRTQATRAWGKKCLRDCIVYDFLNDSSKGDNPQRTILTIKRVMF